jgi:uncharacterized damage-inducible protein DinB
MTPVYIRLLYHYNAWANGRVLDSAAQLDPEQLTAKVSAAFDSIHDTLVHIMGGQWIWLSRWQGTSPSAMLNPVEFADLPAIRQWWTELEQATQAFVDELDEAALEQAVKYTTTGGRPRAFPLWQLMLQQVNHATQHRSEIAGMLTRLGHSPGNLDLIRYLEQQQNK